VRPLLIDNETRAKVKLVLDFAEQPENYYIVGAGGFSFQRPPSDDDRHVTWIPVGFKCVFSMTRSVAEGKLYRHLSISVPAAGKYPNPYAAYVIAELFGFTGWNQKAVIPPPVNWLMNVNKEEHCVMLAQAV
jgi:hypothetical protein